MSVTVGLLAPRRGEVAVYEHRVTGSSPEAIAAHGVALVPQGRRVFRSLTVRENLAVAGAPAARRAARRRGRSTLSTVCSRGSASAIASSPARCRGASSRCSPSAAR